MIVKFIYINNKYRELSKHSDVNLKQTFYLFFATTMIVILN